MNSRFMVMLFIALLLAGGAAWIANDWIEKQSSIKPVVASENTIPVVVAATEIPFGTRLESSQIKLLPWPKDHIPADSFRETQPVVGKIAKRSFIKNEILLKAQIRTHLGGSTLSALISEGNRAMSVRVDDVVGVAGFILPGNTVDIIATRRGSKGTYTLLKNIKVLAIDQESSPDREKPAVVRALTLEVTPKQSEKLVQAMKSGTLQFTLRNPLDNVEIIVPDTGKKKPKKIVRPYVPPSIIILPWTNDREKKCKGGVC